MAFDRLGSLARAGMEVPASILCREVDVLFRSDNSLRSVIVTTGSEFAPFLINRTTFYEVMTGPHGYGWVLFSARPVAQILGSLEPALTRAADDPIIETGLGLLRDGRTTASDDLLVLAAGEPPRSVSVSDLLAAVADLFRTTADEMTATERRFRALVEAGSDLIAVVDRQGVIAYLSAAAERAVGRPATPDAFALVHPDDRAAAKAVTAALLCQPNESVEVTFRLRRCDGSWRLVEGTVRNLVDDPAVQGMVVNVKDVTERRELETELRHRAFHDGLTGLPNRTLITEQAGRMLETARRNNLPCAVMLIDIDHFKQINDQYGHSAGDQLLLLVAERLRLTLRASDSVGRIGGDEFVVLIEGEELAGGAEPVAHRILDAFRDPFVVHGRSLPVTASVGFAVGLRNGIDELFRDADIALYDAKTAGRNRSSPFTTTMRETLERRAWLVADLPGALERGEFLLHFQPAVSLADGAITGVEALLRWQHPTRGLIQPDQFISVAEESALIMPIGAWVLAESCRMASALRRAGHPVTISVNVSPRQLDDDHRLYHDVVAALSSAGLDASALVLEITESALMRDAESSARNLQRLKNLGVRIAIDDFGTGYSSLSYLASFPVDYLKIDRSFIANLGVSAEAEALLRSVLNLGRALSLITVAEGIETDDQLRAVRQEGCDQGQGFLVGRPVPADELHQRFRLEQLESV